MFLGLPDCETGSAPPARLLLPSSMPGPIPHLVRRCPARRPGAGACVFRSGSSVPGVSACPAESHRSGSHGISDKVLTTVAGHRNRHNAPQVHGELRVSWMVNTGIPSPWYGAGPVSWKIRWDRSQHARECAAFLEWHGGKCRPRQPHCLAGGMEYIERGGMLVSTVEIRPETLLTRGVRVRASETDP